MPVMLWAMRLGGVRVIYAVLVNGMRSCAGRADDSAMSRVRGSAAQLTFHDANCQRPFRNILSSICLPMHHIRDYYRL